MGYKDFDENLRRARKFEDDYLNQAVEYDYVEYDLVKCLIAIMIMIIINEYDYFVFIETI